MKGAVQGKVTTVLDGSLLQMLLSCIMLLLLLTRQDERVKRNHREITERQSQKLL